MTQITIPNQTQAKKYYHIDKGVLLSIDLPISLRVIGYGVFLSAPTGTPLLPDFVIPSNIDVIESEAFSNNNIKYLYIPKSVTCIESRAFAECKNLQFVYFETSDSGSIRIDDNAFEPTNGIIFIGNNNIVRHYASDHFLEYIPIIEIDPGFG